MAPEQSTTLTLQDLSCVVRLRPPGRCTLDEAAKALGEFLRRKRPGLAEMLRVRPAGEGVAVTARGNSPQEALRELHELLRANNPGEPAGEIAVDAEEFAVDVTERERYEAPRMVLRSRVRSFPYPVCQWFDISTGLLILTEDRIIYEPEDLIMDNSGLAGSHLLVLDLTEIKRAYRGSWWDVPCLMLETEKQVHRYGWPARRDEPELEFQVGEWLDAVRFALPGAGKKGPRA